MVIRAANMINHQCHCIFYLKSLWLNKAYNYFAWKDDCASLTFKKKYGYIRLHTSIQKEGKSDVLIL